METRLFKEQDIGYRQRYVETNNAITGKCNFPQ